MITLVLLIEYVGTNFSGWQIQTNARSVQEEIQKAYRILTGNIINLTGSGRTDAGVHAKGQIASGKVDKIIIPEDKLVKALNSILIKDIKILKANYLEDKFNARFDALDREYEYILSKEVDVFNRNYITEIKLPFDENKLFEISEIFLGNHDFTTFSKVNPDLRINKCTVTESRWEMININTYKYHIRANHFLYGMVRALVGVMLDYARIKRSKEDILKAFAAKDRQLASVFLPPNGLYLTNVRYPSNFEEIIF